MRILIYGAGVIGSIFAGKTAQAGYDVTMLARKQRCRELKNDGLVMVHSLTGKKDIMQVNVIEKLESDDIYDFILVAVQNTQIEAILPVLKENKSSNIVFVVNNPSGYKAYIDAVGFERVMIGFPSAGGERKNGAVHYFIGTGITKLFQSTTFGDLSGDKTGRLNQLVQIFRNAGFQPAVCVNMDAWQKTHVAVVLPICRALYAYNSDNYKLAKSWRTISDMVLATRECFHVLKSLSVKVTPWKLNFYFLPRIFIIPAYMLIMNTKIAEYAMAKHTITAKDEISALENAFEKMIVQSGLSVPAYQRLLKLN